MSSVRTSAETARLQDEAFLKLRIPKHETKAKQLGDFLRTYLKQREYQRNLLRSREERKQIAEEFLDARGATVPFDSNNREYFWPDHDLHIGNTWPGESRVQDILADWLFHEGDQQKSPKRHKPRLSTGGLFDGEDRRYGARQLQTPSRDQPQREELAYSPDGDIPHTDPLQAKGAEKRKATAVDVFDFDLDEFLPEGEDKPSSTNVRPANETPKTRPNKLARFTFSNSKAGPSQVAVDTESTKITPSPPPPPQPLKDGHILFGSISSAAGSSSNSGRPPEPANINPPPQTADAVEPPKSLDQLDRRQAQLNRSRPGALSKSFPGSQAANGRDNVPPALRSLLTAMEHPIVSMPPRTFRQDKITQVPYLFMDRIEKEERAHIQMAEDSDNLDHAKTQLGMASVLRNLRDELKDMVTGLEIKYKADGSTDFAAV